MNLRLLRVISSMMVIVFFCTVVSAASDQVPYVPHKHAQTTSKRTHPSNSKTKPQPEATQPQTEYEYNAPNQQKYPQPNNEPMTKAHKMISF